MQQHTTLCVVYRNTAYCIWSVISPFIWDHIHMGSHSYGIPFIWDPIHMGSHSYRCTAYCIWSVIPPFSNLNHRSKNLAHRPCVCSWTGYIASMHNRLHLEERWGAGVETQKNVRGVFGGWGRVPFNEPYAPSLSTIYDGA